LFFNCPFDTASDEYPDVYTVYRMAPDFVAPSEGSTWAGLEEQGTLLGAVPVSQLKFDGTSRAAVSAGVLEPLFES
jgi:hypothetical protein